MVVVVTGAAGKTGRAVVEDLVAHGHDVRAVDIAGVPGDRGVLAALGAPLLHADLTDFGDTVDALHGADAVVHLAAIPAPGFVTDARTLATNVTMTSNILLAAGKLGLARVVWTSSETTLGFPFGPDSPPRYLPVDEEHYPYPRSAYALSKVVGETLAEQVSGWLGLPVVTLRLSNVHVAADYPKIPSYQGDVRSRVFNLWGYVDARDVAQACRGALLAPVSGARAYLIAAEDTLMDRPSAELVAEVFPHVPVRAPIPGHATLLSIERARAELGYQPQHDWRSELEGRAR